jgi:hypothetical protein
MASLNSTQRFDEPLDPGMLRSVPAGETFGAEQRLEHGRPAQRADHDRSGRCQVDRVGKTRSADERFAHRMRLACNEGGGLDRSAAVWIRVRSQDRAGCRQERNRCLRSLVGVSSRLAGTLPSGRDTPRSNGGLALPPRTRREGEYCLMRLSPTPAPAADDGGELRCRTLTCTRPGSSPTARAPGPAPLPPRVDGPIDAEAGSEQR